MLKIFRRDSDSDVPPPKELRAGGQQRLPGIDGLRACAMLMVFLLHIWQFADSPLLQIGPFALGDVLLPSFTAGVDLFMVLSGFCLFWPLARDPAKAASWNWRDYAKRRVHRILPPYYASIVYVTLLPVMLVVLVRAVGVEAKWQELPSLWQYLTHLTFIHTFFPSTWSGIQGVYWSLGLEAQFYIVFPLVVIGFRRVGMWVLLPMVILSLAYRYIAGYMVRDEPWTTQFLVSIFFLGRWMQFAAGMGAAWVVARWSSKPPGALTATALLAAAAALYGLASAVREGDLKCPPTRELYFAGSFAILIIVTAATRTFVRKLFESPIMVFLGLISYSFFLVHQNSVYYLSELVKRGLHVQGPALFIFLATAGFALCLGGSYLFFLAFERPFLFAKKPKQPMPQLLPITPTTA